MMASNYSSAAGDQIETCGDNMSFTSPSDCYQSPYSEPIVNMSRPNSVSSAGAPLGPLSETCKSPYQQHAETFERLEMAQKRKSQSETELQSLVLRRSNTPSMSPNEVNETERTICNLKKQIEMMNYQIQEMLEKLNRQETIITQQQTTIRNQSKAIENPRGNSQFVSTNPRQPGQHNRPSVFPEAVSHGPPPPYGSPHGANSRGGERRTWNYQHQNMSMSTLSDALPVPDVYNQARSSESSLETSTAASSRQPSFHGVDDYGSPHRVRNANAYYHQPKQLESNNGLTAIYSEVSTGNRTRLPETRAAVTSFNEAAPTLPQSLATNFSPESTFSNPYPDDSKQSQRIDRDSREWTSVDSLGARDAAISHQFGKVFACCKNWALNHCNFPNTSGDNALPQELKGRIIRAATMQTAFPLMKQPETRYWLVTKLMIQYVIKHILRQNAFAGLDRESDQCIEGLRQTIYHSTPSPVRFVILKNIAEKTRKIMSNNRFPAYLNYLTRTRAERLFWDFRSLKHNATMLDQEDILVLVAEAHRLAQMINTSTDEYAFNWADVGDRFDRFAMSNVCPRYGACTDDEMRARWATVRLCATPEVVIRQNSPNSSMVNEIKVQKMRVLLKVRNDE